MVSYIHNSNICWTAAPSVYSFFFPGDSQLNHGSVIGLTCKGEVSVAATHANAHMSLSHKNAMGESLGWKERGPVMYMVVVLL